MKRHWIDYHDTRPQLPMTYWVHREPANGKPWYEATEFDPPREPLVAGRGYPVFHVEVDGFTFSFSSRAEIEECIRVLSQRHMPRALDLANARDGASGLNTHWLSRLPARVKSWKYREKATRYLREALLDFEKETSGSKGPNR